MTINPLQRMKTVFILLLTGLLVAFRPAGEPMQVFLIGDSTMADKPNPEDPERGWGQYFPACFDASVRVQNHAVNGRSTKSFISEGRWTKVIDQVRPGDYVFIQFGHNDSKIADSTRYAAPQTTYRDNLLRFVRETQAKGGKPVLLTPVMRRRFDESGAFVDTHGEYPAVVKAVASTQNVPLIDLHKKSQVLISGEGPDGSKMLFMHYGKGYFASRPDGVKDDTHFSEYGATRVAALVADGMREVKLELASHLIQSPFAGKYAYELPTVARPVFRKDTVNILKFGAKADGQTLNTTAIGAAIDAIVKAGGGTVLIPRGLWLTGPIVLKSNVNLHLTKGALVQFTDQKSEYALIKTNWEGLDAVRNQAPLSGVDLENIAITGEGIMDGAGDAWRMVKKSKLNAGQWQKLVASGGVLNDKKDTWYPSEASLKGSLMENAGVIKPGSAISDYADIKDFLRPNMVSLTRCKRVLLDGVTFQNSPAWCLHPLLCENITVSNLTVKNPWYAQNGDGLDLESCRNGLVDNCTFDVGDDGICIKSGRDEQGRKRGVPTENIVVRNSRVYHAHGGFVIGSEMSGGARNIYVSNCTFMGTDVGLRFKTARGRGGIVENIFVNGVDMTDIAGEAILFDMYYMAKDPVPQPGESRELPAIAAQPVNEGTPQFRSFFIKNITCKGAETGILVRGLPEMAIRDISIENAVLQCNKGMVCVEAEDIRLKNVALLSVDKTVIQAQNARNITLDAIDYPDGTDLLINVTGSRSKNIRLLHTNTAKAKKEVALGTNVPASTVLKN